MQQARLPENEACRVAALHSLGILDTKSEGRFDRFTRITARIFDTPIALISLVDRHRQWFKAVEGLTCNETPRNISFCGHAILGDDVFEIRNARRDPRFRDNPLVVGPPRIRFYAGAPLRGPGGHKLGTLCIIDTVPRQLSDDEKNTLQNLADIVVDEITRFVDVEVDRSHRTAHTVTGTEFFDSIPEERGLSVLLFDIDDVLSSHDESNPGVSPGEVFTELLHDHFPTAQSIAHIGDYHFCVLLSENRDFDEVRAINRLCSNAKDLLRFADGHDFLTPFVGRIHCDSEKYASIDDMVRDADEMFLRHERPRSPEKTDIIRVAKALVGWRETIF